MSKLKKIIVLLSGGMDSVAALYETKQHNEVVATLSFNYGSKHNSREIPFAAHHSRLHGIPHHVVSLDFINEFFKSDLLKSGGEIPKGHYAAENMKKTVVPFRNGIMLSIAAGFAESVGALGVAIAAHTGDHTIYADCRADFMSSMGDAIRLGTDTGIEILRPFIAMTKAEIASRGHELGVDFANTWSCYVGGEIHCGECGTCIERREAFMVACIPDPTTYLNTVPIPLKPG